MRSFDVIFDFCLKKRLSEQSWGWWFEMPSCPLWRHCNDYKHEPYRHTHTSLAYRGNSNCYHITMVAFILSPDSIWRCHLTSTGNLVLEIRWSQDRLISTMGFPILVRWHLYIESGSLFLTSPLHFPCLQWERISTNCIIVVNRESDASGSMHF